MATITVQISRAISRFEKAVREHAWLGSQPPQTWPQIEDEYLKAKTGLERAIAKLIHRS